MPKIVNIVPKYRRHRASGQAVVTICGQDRYLGLWGTKASKIEYDRLIGEWLARVVKKLCRGEKAGKAGAGRRWDGRKIVNAKGAVRQEGRFFRGGRAAGRGDKKRFFQSEPLCGGGAAVRRLADDSSSTDHPAAHGIQYRRQSDRYRGRDR